MKSRPSEMTSACDIYRQLIKSPPNIRKQHVGGGVAVNVSPGNFGELTLMPSDHVKSFDEDTNNLLRAKCACEQGFVVSPYSKSGNIMFASPEEYPKQLEEIQLKEKEEATRKKQGWFSNFSGEVF